MFRMLAISALFASSTAIAHPPAATDGASAPAAPASTDATGPMTWVNYGAEATIETAPIKASDFLADPATHVDKTILVEGTVADVCQKKGCWMVLAEGDKSIRVLTKDHGFAVAMDSTGQTCRIEGVVKAKEIKADEVAHFESESANKDLIPEKKVKGKMTYELVASSVQILRPEDKSDAK